MPNANEELKVGIVVVASALLFLIALVFVGGVNLLRKKRVEYTTYFRFAGGLEPGSLVRYGGFKVGTVKSAALDRADPTRIRVEVQVDPGTPVKTDSKARISSLGFLGENYLEISAGSRNALPLRPGGEIPAVEIVQLADVFNNVNNITVDATRLVNDLDTRILTLSDNANQLVKSLNDLVGPANKAHLNALLANADGMLAESRPHLEKTLASLDAASSKLTPALDNLNAAVGKASGLADHLDGVIVENRKDIRESLVRLQASLTQAERMISDLDDALGANRGNLDETLENIRVTSENLKEFTDTVKRRPFSLIRVKTEKDREPPSPR